MERKLYDTICENLNQSSSIKFSFAFVTKGIEYSPDFKNVSAEDHKFLANKIHSWIYEILESFQSLNAYFDRGDIEFILKNTVLTFNGNFEIDDNGLYTEQEHFINEVLTGNIEKLISKHLNIDIDDLEEDLFNYHIDLDNDKGIKDFTQFQIFYDGEEIELDEEKTLIIKNEIFDIISQWSGPYVSDMGEVVTNIYCQADEYAFTCLDKIYVSEEIEITDE
mgnify:CR=1 FL=1|tara:strand:- start:1579 stop:2244 length:666 start_codon:yes stop_codon:yes gene_type:complete